ncbi:exocyst complex component 6-like isoform X1 [Artemia franciscana]
MGSYGNIDALINELESVEENWSSTFRAIYEHQDQENLLAKLDARIRFHTREIEKLCASHLPGFMESVKQVQDVKEALISLKDEVMIVQNESLSTLISLKAKTEEFEELNRYRQNLKALVELLEKCLPAFDVHQNLQKDISKKDYYIALRKIDELNEKILPSLINFFFIQKLKDSLPDASEKIKEGSLEDLRLFLEEARVVSKDIGKAAIQMVQYLGEDNPFGEEDDEEVSPEAYVSFIPVYKTMHVFKKLNSTDSLVEYYQNQRFQQMKLTLQHPANLHEKPEEFESYCYGIVGFFVTEDHLRRTLPELVTTNFCNELWGLTVKMLNASVTSQVDLMTNSDHLVRIKALLVSFSATMKMYGYDVSELRSVLINASDLYYEILMHKCTHSLRLIFDEDNYQPLEVSSEEEYKKLIDLFPETATAKYPIKYPFSPMVLKIYLLFKEYILECKQFVQDMSLSRRELAEGISKAVTLLIDRSLSGCFSDLLKSNLSILQVIQLSINIVHLEESMKALEAYIRDLNNIQEGAQSVKLHGTLVFKDLLSEAESQIYERLKSKIDEFFELSAYDWTLSEPSGQPSGFVSDLRFFLNSTFSAFGIADLRVSVAQEACYSACKHVSDNFLERLLSDDVKAVSQSALQQINLDLMQCEQFAASAPVHGFQDGDFLICFAELRQLLDVCLAGDWTNYFKDYGKETSKYKDVKPETCVVLMEKLREGEKKSMLVSMKKTERDKKKIIETVLKQLRQLVNTQS